MIQLLVRREPRAWLQRAWSYVSDTTGLVELDRLKEEVHAKERSHEKALLSRAEALRVHDAAVASRSVTQAELSRLLQRKDSWDAEDVQRFTALLTRDYETRGDVEQSLEARGNAERDAEAAQRNYMRAVQASYQTELLFSKKISTLSLYGTSALIIVNTVIFVASTVLRSRSEAERLEAFRAAATDLTASADRVQAMLADKTPHYPKGSGGGGGGGSTDQASQTTPEPLDGVRGLLEGPVRDLLDDHRAVAWAGGVGAIAGALCVGLVALVRSR
ncbi:hypothetical protein CTAYLR_004568 [Chrysophaeum taylorii]|uniref:Sensitive to high expression protein 9, mitochondrial n=1 Tax=Chrysophaeum taylorii TaxID=2483200 RepID=A0AAD7XP77_9STRA|nr:hypothetical protein CTAYLR_004568 [Chrysophaeum taylorii]